MTSLRPSTRSKPAIREVITYPTIAVTSENNSCLDFTMPFEHILACGHIVTTAHPDEPCALNCHHVKRSEGGLDRSLRSNKAGKMRNGKAVSENHFYCDACIETENEALIPPDLNGYRAEQRRAVLRINSAANRGKGTLFRKCYIGLKVSTIPCHDDGTISKKYVACLECHPFDTAVPRSGENMFEDVDLRVHKKESGGQEKDKTVGNNLDPVRIRKRGPRSTMHLGLVVDAWSTSPVDATNTSCQLMATLQGTKADKQIIAHTCSTQKRSRVVPEDSDDEGEYTASVTKKRCVAPLTSSSLNTRRSRQA